MVRNLDIATLRSLLAIADTGGVTRAANRLHLTQSAVSMQIKRLEVLLGFAVLEREGRNIRLTAQGERLCDFARRLVRLNDETVDTLTTPRYEGELTFGTPTDIVYPHVHDVLRRFGREFPRMSVRLVTEQSRTLLDAFDKGLCDVILTTEQSPPESAEILVRQPLLWTGAIDTRIWRQRPLPLAISHGCIFREPARRALEEAGIAYVDAVLSGQEDAAVLAAASDLGVRADLASSVLAGLARVEHQGSLPELPQFCVVLYRRHDPAGQDDRPQSDIIEFFCDMLRDAYCGDTSAMAPNRGD